MIIVRLIGGLGNQFFQYALGLHLAEIHKTILKFDISRFETYKLHKYSLWAFKIQESFASHKEIIALKFQKQGIAGRIVRRVLGKPSKSPQPVLTYIQEKREFSFDPDILNLPDNIYLEGYWQNEKYFAGIEAIIRQEFTVKTPPSGKNKELIEEMASCESVSVHIRRGDYIADSKTMQVHGICDLDYYSRCVTSLTQILKNPYFYIFSDEPEWTRNNLKLSYPTTLVDHNGTDKNYEDLRLMSQCKHHIIANSTFSWWGAWLSRNSGKIVLAPKNWFKSGEYNVKDLIPEGWIKI